MIIRPVVSREFIALPNAILKDRRLSADTRAMIALLLSKPKSWQLRPPAIAHDLSRKDSKPVGRARLKRMFDEAIAAGYMARSASQTHADGGLWGPYLYFMGMPEDVAAAVAKEGVAVLPQAEKPHTAKPHTVEPHTVEPCAANQHPYKRKNLETTESIKPLSDLSPPTASAPAADNRGSNWKSRRDAKHAALDELRTFTESVRGRRAIEGQEVVHRRLAERLGYGDVEAGYLIIFGLSDSRRDQLTAMERVGTLSDWEIVEARAAASELQR